MQELAQHLITEFRHELASRMPRVEQINGFRFTPDYGPEGWGPLWFFDGIVVDGRERGYHDIKESNRALIDQIIRETIASVRDQGVGDLIARHFAQNAELVPSAS